MDFENRANPFFERKYTIEKWRDLAKSHIEETNDIFLKANGFAKEGIKPKDALHLACAIEMKCKYFFNDRRPSSKKGQKSWREKSG